MNTINLYDFDGVLASPFEEALFTLPEYPLDSAFVASVSEALSLDLSNESRQSARYICLQAVMLAIGHPISPGPIFDQMEGPCHIITARCDRFAVARMHETISQLPIKPIKTIHLDHLPKGQMIKVMLERHPETYFKFWDDNPRQIESALALKSDRLEVFHVDNDMAAVYEEAESFYRYKILDKHLA